MLIGVFSPPDVLTTLLRFFPAIIILGAVAWFARARPRPVLIVGLVALILLPIVQLVASWISYPWLVEQHAQLASHGMTAEPLAYDGWFELFVDSFRPGLSVPMLLFSAGVVLGLERLLLVNSIWRVSKKLAVVAWFVPFFGVYVARTEPFEPETRRRLTLGFVFIDAIFIVTQVLPSFS